MIYYFDTSALAKAFVEEKGSKEIIDILKAGIPSYSSMVLYPEMLFVFRRKRNHGEINENEFQNGLTSFDEKWGFFNTIDLSAVFGLLRNRVIKYPLRALDAIHLASALWVRENIDIDCKFVCSDPRLLEVAKEENFEWFNPAE